MTNKYASQLKIGDKIVSRGKEWVIEKLEKRGTKIDASCRNSENPGHTRLFELWKDQIVTAY